MARTEVTTHLAERYRTVRAETERLAQPLGAEDQTVQSMPDVSPTKWHRAHVTWFFETFVLGRFVPGYRPYDPAFAHLFNSYYEAAGPRYPRPQRGLITRPGVGEVTAYRQVVDDAVADLLADHRATDRGGEELAALVELGLHHEQQHQELLLMDIKHVLSANPMRPAYRPGVEAWSPSTTAPRRLGWVDHPGGLVEVGHRGDGFAFDNERPDHQVWLEPFGLADRLVTAGEWLEFMDDGGYRRAELWLSDGWAAVATQGWRAPLYWTPGAEDQDGWSLFTLGGERPVDPSEPVCHVSHYEADAFARWAGRRLPTEFEWEAAVVDSGAAVGHRQIELHPSVCDVGVGLGQVGTDVWEWTASAYLPYPRFRPASGAVGEYNGKFMSGQMVLRSGACITPAGHTRATYRNFFPAAARWVMGGVRLATER